MKKIILFFITILSNHIISQDKITMLDGSEIMVKLLEINENEIKYKPIDNSYGPLKSIFKESIFLITYQNGQKEFINNPNQKIVNNKIQSKIIENKAFEKNTLLITAGYGYPNLYDSFFRGSINIGFMGSYKEIDKNSFGPGFIKAEFGINENIGIGLSTGYRSVFYNYTTMIYDTINLIFDSCKIDTKETHTNFSIGFRLNWHFLVTENTDAYFGFAAGGSVGENTVVSSSLDKRYFPYQNNFIVSSGNVIPLYFALTLGLRYYVDSNFGFYTEVGIDKWAIIQGGVVYKF